MEEKRKGKKGKEGGEEEREECPTVVTLPSS
jgi:hypothetical protein